MDEEPELQGVDPPHPCPSSFCDSFRPLCPGVRPERGSTGPECTYSKSIHGVCYTTKQCRYLICDGGLQTSCTYVSSQAYRV